MLALQSSLQPFPQAHLCCELFKRFDPCATAPLPTTPLQVVQGLQSLHFVFCHFCLSCKAGMYSFNHLFQKLSAKNLSVSTSFLPKCLPSQKNQVAKCEQLSSVVGGWGSKVCIHWDQNCTEGPGVQYQLHLSENCCEHLFLHQALVFVAIWVLHISLSQTPLACEALGSWNIYWHPFCSSLSWISFWFQLSLAPLIYLSATMKLVLLSE